MLMTPDAKSGEKRGTVQDRHKETWQWQFSAISKVVKRHKLPIKR